MYVIKKKLSGGESHPSPHVSRLVISDSHAHSWWKKFLKAWDGDKGPRDAKAKFLNPAAGKETTRVADIFTILIRALKCFRLSFIALVSLSCLRKKKHSSSRLSHVRTNRSLRETVNEMALYLWSCVTNSKRLDAVKNRVRHRVIDARITEDKMPGVFIWCSRCL